MITLSSPLVLVSTGYRPVTEQRLSARAADLEQLPQELLLSFETLGLQIEAGTQPRARLRLFD